MNQIGKTAVLVTAVSLAAAVGGCGMAKRDQSVIESVAQSSADAVGPDLETHTGIVIDFDEAQDSCEELIEDEDIYTLSSYIDTAVDEDTKTVMLIWPLDNSATEEDGVVYANEIVRAFNDACQEQDFSIALSSEDYYGGLYETYAVNVQVFREQDILSPENYFVSMTIPAGSYEEIVPFSQYDGLNEVYLSDGPAMIPGGKYSGELETSAEEDVSEEETSAEEDTSEEETSEAEEDTSEEETSEAEDTSEEETSAAE